MNDPKVFSNPCAVCRVNVATQLCDYVIDYDRTVLFLRNQKDFIEANKSTRYVTCDLQICEKCSHQRNYVDFCPDHYKLFKEAELVKLKS